MIYLIHTEDGWYYPNNWCDWTQNSNNAKKYVSKPAMFKKIRILEREMPNKTFYFETFELVSKGSQTLTTFKRIQKINNIKNKTRDRGGPF